MRFTPKEIMDKGQVLTIGKAKELTGRYIYITNREYWANEPTVRRVLVNPNSEWDAAKKDHTAKGFDNRAGLLEVLHEREANRGDAKSLPNWTQRAWKPGRRDVARDG